MLTLPWKSALPRQPEGNGTRDWHRHRCAQGNGAPATPAPQMSVPTARTRSERGTPMPASLSSGGRGRPAPSLPSGPRLCATDGPGRRPQQTRQTDRRETHTRTYRDTQRHTQRPLPRSLTKACAIPDRGRRARAPSAAFEPRAPFPTGARARAAGGSAPATPPRSRPIGHAPGRAARLGARGCCACAEAAAAPAPPARLSVRGRAGHASRSFILPVGNCSSNPRVSKRCKASLVTTGRCNFFFKILLKNSTTSKKQLLENVRAQYLTVTAKHCPKPQF